MLLIVTFVPQEARPLLRRLTERQRLPTVHRVAHRGRFAGIPAVLAPVGMGARNAERGFEAICQTVRVTGVAVCGVAAGLDPALRVGDLVLAEGVRSEEDEELHHPSNAPLPGGGAPFRRGMILTVSRVLATTAEKQALAELAVAADMETAVVVRAAERRHLPWCALRAISDTADEALALDFNRCTGPTGDLHLPRLLREVARQPAAIPALVRLGQNTARAAEALAEAAAGYLPGWHQQGGSRQS